MKRKRVEVDAGDAATSGTPFQELGQPVVSEVPLANVKKKRNPHGVYVADPVEMDGPCFGVIPKATKTTLRNYYEFLANSNAESVVSLCLTQLD